MFVIKNSSSSKINMESYLPGASNWAIDVQDIRTIKVAHVSMAATEQDIRDFFLFSGDIQYIEMQRESEASQLAFITFVESQGADRAMLLSGATIVDHPVKISLDENYQLPPSAFVLPLERRHPATTDSQLVKMAENAVSSVLAKGYILGKDALNTARDFEERHKIISNASATVTSLDKKMGFTEKLLTGTAAVGHKVKEVEERYQLLEKTRSTLEAAEQARSLSGAALMNNRYISYGTSWLLRAARMVSMATSDVATLTMEKVDKADKEKLEMIHRARTGFIRDFAEIHLDDESSEDKPTIVPVASSGDIIMLAII